MMLHQAAVPFQLRRSQDAFSGGSVTSTTEVVHGLLRLDGEVGVARPEKVFIPQ